MWNRRQEVDTEVKKLTASFLREGCNRFTFRNFIPIIVKRSFVEDGTFSSDPRQGEKLPLLQLCSGVPTGHQLRGASGQHRARALGKWISQQKSQLSKVKQQAKQIERMDSRKLTEDDTLMYNKNIRPELDEMEAALALGGQWGVALYDEGEIYFTSQLQ